MRRPLFKRLFILLVLPISALALASCGKDAGPAKWNPAAPDACDVITERDATTALGEDSGSGKASNSGGLYWCHFGPPSNIGLDINISPVSGFTPSTFTEFQQSTLSSGLHSEWKSLDGGIGDAAFVFADSAPPQWTVTFLKGTSVIFVYVPLNGRDSAKVEQLAIDLARTIADRM
jgi:hypothetical protein